MIEWIIQRHIHVIQNRGDHHYRKLESNAANRINFFNILRAYSTRVFTKSVL